MGKWVWPFGNGSMLSLQSIGSFNVKVHSDKNYFFRPICAYSKVQTVYDCVTCPQMIFSEQELQILLVLHDMGLVARNLILLHVNNKSADHMRGSRKFCQSWGPTLTTLVFSDEGKEDPNNLPMGQSKFSYALTFWFISFENGGKQKSKNTLRVEIN